MRQKTEYLRLKAVDKKQYSRYRTKSALHLAFCFLSACLFFLPGAAFGAQRFPPPEFETGHELPITTVPNPRADVYEYLDVAILLITLSLASYLALKKRSRRGIFVLGIFSLLYFGFWRKGCVCPIGAIQNISLALFNHSYTVPITVAAFFILPLVFALFFGRTFCASVCPLGAIQDIVLLRPVKVPSWAEHALGMISYVYFGLAVLAAATGSAFIICEYDPFVSFFRRSGNLNILILGVCFLLIGVFIGRPYCRYICPYSVLLRWMSSASKWHVSIAPDKCIQCRLCEDSCPFEAIQKPTQNQPSRIAGRRALAIMIVLLPMLTASGSLLGVHIGGTLSHLNATVRLAERIWLEDTEKVKDTIQASDAFRGTGKLKEELYKDALSINRRFAIGSGIFGAFVGLIFGMKMIWLIVRRKRTDYEANRATCLSCGRCFAYCPVLGDTNIERK